MIKNGAKTILGFFLTLSMAVLAWAGNSIIENQKEIAELRAYRISTKELILRIDKKIDKNSSKIDKVIELVR